MSKASFMLGFIAGLTSPAEMMAQKEPVAYLYNGVRLPKLPTEHQNNDAGVKLDYAIIQYDYSSDVYKLYFTSQPLRHRDWFGSEQVISTIFPYYWYKYEFEKGTDWDSTKSKLNYSNNTDAGLTDLMSGDSFVWSNHNIYKEDGTLYLAATEPIPVYEGSVTT